MQNNSQNQVQSSQERMKQDIQQTKDKYVLEEYQTLLKLFRINDYKDAMHRVITEIARSEAGEFGDPQSIAERCDALYTFFERIEELENPNCK